MPSVLASTIEFHGRGLFTNRPVTLRLEPAPPTNGGHAPGLWLAAFDREPVPIVHATIDEEPIHPVFARVPARSTNLRLPDGTRLATLEHVLSALVGSHVIGATIRLRPRGEIGAHPGDATPLAPIEAPIFDGSARTITDALRGAATRPFDDTFKNPHHHITPSEPMLIQGDQARGTNDPDAPSIRIDPPAPDQPHAIYRYMMAYSNQNQLHTSLHASTAAWHGDPTTYATDIAPARTYATDAEARALQDAGLGAHLTPRDALVIAKAGPIDNELRFPNEPARHKLLDLIGDLALAARPINAIITADRAGHALNHKAALALRAIWKDHT